MNKKIKSEILQASLMLIVIALSVLGAASHASELDEHVAARFAAAELACKTAQNAAQQPWLEQIGNAVKSGDGKAAAYAGCRYHYAVTLACMEAMQAISNFPLTPLSVLPTCN